VAPASVSVYTLPDGSGHPISDCYLFGGERTDATISLVLRDQDENPVPDYPAEDIWLQTMQDGLVLCPEGSIADGPTDANGMTTFSSAVRGGGASDPEAGEITVVVVGGCASYRPGRTILFNSPDLNGDLVVNLADVVTFAVHFFGDYTYAADFFWDGEVNLSDLTHMVGTLSATCP